MGGIKPVWLWPDQGFWEAKSDDPWGVESDLTDIGSCELSLVNGPRYGSAKKANVVIAKIPSKKKGISGNRPGVTMGGWMAMAALVLQDLSSTDGNGVPNGYGKPTKSVVLTPRRFNSGPQIPMSPIDKVVVSYLKSLVEWDAVVVTAAGMRAVCVTLALSLVADLLINSNFRTAMQTRMSSHVGFFR